jgi:hypothetical protein
MTIFLEKIINYFYEFQISEKYMSNCLQISRKKYRYQRKRRTEHRGECRAPSLASGGMRPLVADAPRGEG